MGDARPAQGLPQDARGTETVLLVEDDAGVRRVATEALKRLGYRVLPGATATEAISLAESFDGPIDLVLTDVVMPDLNGRVLGERIQRLRPQVKVLYMSGYAPETIERHGLLGPGFIFIEKPFTLEELARKVRRVLAA